MTALRRATAFGFFGVVLVLGATAEAVYARPMDELSIAWFAALATSSALASACLGWTLLSHFRRGELRTTLDSFFWMALPFCVGLLAIAIWTLGWHFLGWE